MKAAPVVYDSQMREAFKAAYAVAHHTSLRGKVGRKLRTSKGRIYSRGWRVNRRKKT